MDFQLITKKSEEYGQFIEKLKVDLKEIDAAITDKVSQYTDWEDVKKVVNIVKEYRQKDCDDMLVRVNSESNVMFSGEISDFKNTYISIGLGYILEMDCEEADKYSDIRLKLLKKEIDHLRKLAIDVKVHIKLTLLAINELKVHNKHSEKQ